MTDVAVVGRSHGGSKYVCFLSVTYPPKKCVCVLAWEDVVSMEAPGTFCSVESCLSARHKGV